MNKNIFYGSLLMVSFASANDVFSSCNIDVAAGMECITNINELHPGQSDVGMFVIRMTKPEKGIFLSTSKKCDSKALDQDLQKRGTSKKGIAGVIGPKGIIYLIDGHHSTYSLYLLANQKNSCGYDGKVYVYIVDNKSNYNESEFYDYMKSNQYVWLKDSYGKEIDFSALPNKISKIGDDPYRSLMKLVADSKCNLNNPVIDGSNSTPYLEFYWGNKLKQYRPNYYNLNDENAQSYTLDAYNYVIRNQDKFKDLPGFNVVKNKSLCKKAF
ncbi:MAG: ParB/Srx family N-terminal domain-containing protein [Burkholderiales bacterium]|nr:ParB/Srx family N-terminal domain-containing protein [Burkholderiales bacterium]